MASSSPSPSYDYGITPPSPESYTHLQSMDESSFSLREYKSEPLKASATSILSIKQISKKQKTLNNKSGCGRLAKYNHVWLWELLNCILSVIFLLAIVITLQIHDGQPLPNWPMSITINALISIFGTLLKATMMVPIAEGISQLKWLWFCRPRDLVDFEQFDLASRGFLGSGGLIFMLRGLHLASLGALITVVVVAIDPFFQQIIQLQAQEVASSIGASIPQSNEFSLFSTTGPRKMSLDLDLSTKAAGYNGIINLDPLAFQVRPDCPTANCTFSQPYGTIAVCSKCVDVTEDIQITTAANSTLNSPFTYTLPNGLSIENYNNLWNVTSSTLTNNTRFSSFKQPLSIITVLMTSGLVVEDLPIIHDPWAASCMLYVCVNYYNASITNGILTETRLASFHNASAEIQTSPTGQYELTPKPCLHDEIYGNSTNVSSTYLPMRYNATVPKSKCTFSVHPRLFRSLGAWISGTLFSTGDTYERHRDSSYAFYNNGKSSVDHATLVMSNLAQSVTSTMRTYGETGDPALGVAFHEEIFLKVRWEWITLPVILVALTIIFFAATVWQSGSGDNVYKSSALAVLYHRLDRDWDDGGVGLKAVENRARGRTVMLADSGEGGGGDPFKFVDS